MLRGLFVTGTDTGVGKTVAAAALMHRYRAAFPLCYWKPVQTGPDDDTAEVRRLGACREDEILAEGIRLPDPVSPHLAAQRAGVKITLEELESLVRHRNRDRKGGVCWLVEGAGGALVPLNGHDLMIHLMGALALPVLVVARSTLGTINHTLLTLEALRARSLCIAGVIMAGERNAANRTAIERYGRVPVLGEMPMLEPLEANTLGQWSRAELDPHGCLLEVLA